MKNPLKKPWSSFMEKKGKNPLPIRPMVVGVASRTKSWEWKPSSQAAPGQHPGWSADPLVLDGYAVPPSPSILQTCWLCRSHSSPAIESLSNRRLLLLSFPACILVLANPLLQPSSRLPYVEEEGLSIRPKRRKIDWVFKLVHWESLGNIIIYFWSTPPPPPPPAPCPPPPPPPPTPTLASP